MSDEMRKVQMPSTHMAQKGMTPEERQEHQRRLSKWRNETMPRDHEETEK